MTVSNVPENYTLPDPSVLTDFPNIAFCGRMGAGKTVAAKYLIKRFSYEWHSFADALREECAPDNSRETLQRVGMVRREEDEDYWVNKLLAKLTDERGPYVIDDLRFPNEYWALKEQNFIIVRVVAEQPKRVDRLKGNGKFQSEDQLSHISETALDGYHADYTVFNQDTRDTMYQELINVLYREASRR